MSTALPASVHTSDIQRGDVIRIGDDDIHVDGVSAPFQGLGAEQVKVFGRYSDGEEFQRSVRADWNWALIQRDGVTVAASQLRALGVAA